MREEIAQMDTAAFRKNRISILAGLTRLRQICCDPRLFVEDYEGTSGKLEQVKDLIQAAKKTAAVCSYSHSLQACFRSLKKNLLKKELKPSIYEEALLLKNV